MGKPPPPPPQKKKKFQNFSPFIGPASPHEHPVNVDILCGLYTSVRFPNAIIPQVIARAIISFFHQKGVIEAGQ